MTSWQAVLKMTAFPMITTRNHNEEKEIGVGPGVVNRLDGNENEPGSESITIEKLPDIGIGVLQFIDKTTQIANSALKLNVLGGQAQPGVETATESDQNLRNASVKLSYAVSAIERIVKKMNRWVLMDIQLVLEAPVTIYGAGADSPSEISLKPKDIGGYYETHVELSTADMDAVNQVNARFWAEMYRVVPFLSLYTTMEKMGLDDPQSEMVRRASEDVFLSEEFRLIRTMTGAQSFGELAQLLQQLQMQGGEAAGAGPPGQANPGQGANSVAHMNLEVIRRAEMLQALATAHIDIEYNADRSVTDIEQLTYKNFIDDYQQAHANGDIDALNARYSTLLLPIVQQLMSGEQEGTPQ